MSFPPRPLAILTLLIPGLASCGPLPYRPPTPDQPHAVVKVRRVYETSAGTTLDETCNVADFRALKTRDPVALATAPRTDAFLAHPVPARFEVGAKFSHLEERMVQEAYTVQEPYMATESYSCGTGTSFQTCTRMVTRYRAVTKYRTVLRQISVVDGACRDAVYLSPSVDASYLLDFTYRDNSVCALVCTVQTPGPTGTFASAPCPQLTTAQIDALNRAD